jgi:hypothetical protein
MGKVLVEPNEEHEEIFMKMELLNMNNKIDQLLSMNEDCACPIHNLGVGSHVTEPPLEAPPVPIHYNS